MTARRLDGSPVVCRGAPYASFVQEMFGGKPTRINEKTTFLNVTLESLRILERHFGIKVLSFKDSAWQCPICGVVTGKLRCNPTAHQTYYDDLEAQGRKHLAIGLPPVLDLGVGLNG